MNNSSRIYEIILSALLIIFGTTTLIGSIYISNYDFNFLSENFFIEENGIIKFKVILKHFEPMFFGVASILSGIFLLRNKFSGWFFGVIIWQWYIKNLLCIFFSPPKKATIENIEIVYTIGFVLFFLCLELIMFRDFFIEKYKPRKRTWICFISIILLFVMHLLFLSN